MNCDYCGRTMVVGDYPIVRCNVCGKGGCATCDPDPIGSPCVNKGCPSHIRIYNKPVPKRSKWFIWWR